MAYLAGLMQAVEQTPAGIARVGMYTSLGAMRHTLRALWAGGTADPMLLGTMAVYAAVFGVVAASTFRWE